MARKPVVVVLWFVAFKALNITDILEFESVWCKKTTPKSEYHVASSYLPLILFMTVLIPLNVCQILADDPNAEIIIAGDIMLKSRNWKSVIRDFVFNLQWLVIPKVNFFFKKIVLGRLIKV